VPRLFIAVGVTPDVADDLMIISSGIPGARWQKPDQLHLTLHFLGEVEGAAVRDVKDMLDECIRVDAFQAQLAGCGVFPHRGPPRVLWLGLDGAQAMNEMHRQLARGLDEIGVEFERRRFFPHLTLARFGHAPPERDLAQWIVGHSLYRSPVFRVDQVRLYSSLRGAGGSKYMIEHAVMLDEMEESSAISAEAWPRLS
jgi:2'-5' RNA ligase